VLGAPKSIKMLEHEPGAVSEEELFTPLQSSVNRACRKMVKESTAKQQITRGKLYIITKYNSRLNIFLKTFFSEYLEKIKMRREDDDLANAFALLELLKNCEEEDKARKKQSSFEEQVKKFVNLYLI
jgi:hypothetical protein